MFMLVLTFSSVQVELLCGMSLSKKIPWFSIDGIILFLPILVYPSQVLKANMKKEVGRKETRPNPLGLPDLVKPEGWEAPSHEGNHGKLNDIWFDIR